MVEWLDFSEILYFFSIQMIRISIELFNFFLCKTKHEMFFFLISHILSLSCAHSVTVFNKPANYTFEVDEGEYICINSSLPYVTVVFHNSIVRARYFLHTNINTYVESGNFLFPAEKGGISFGSKKGSVDVMALLPGNLSFSVFAFPPICFGRYVTTRQSTEIVLKEVFKTFQKGHYCVWYPQSYYNAEVSETPEDPDSVSICEDSSDCRDPFVNNKLEQTIKTPSFFKINSHTIDFFKHFTLNLESKSKRPSIPFDMEGTIDITQVTLFDVSASKVGKNAKKEEEAKEKEKEKEEINEENKKIDEEYERNEKEEQKEMLRKPPLEIPPRHDNRRASRKEISPGEIIAMVIVVCSIIVVFITCFLCGGNDSICKRLNSFKGRRRFDEDENIQSEARLLGNSQNRQPMMVAMMPVYSAQNQQQQMPLTGVYFPPVTSDENVNSQTPNGQNNNQNVQPQPLLLLPNPAIQNPNQSQQSGAQPQYFIPQQYYPQYAFVQPQQGYQNPQMQNPVPPSTATTNDQSNPTSTVTDTNATTPASQ